MPFCGLHKTGGWAQQEVPSSSAPAVLQGVEDSDEDVVPGMTMSQSTLQSTQGSFKSAVSATLSSGRKRSYEDDVEDEIDEYFDEMEDAESVEQPIPPANRTKARMKSMLRKAATDGVVRIVGEDDFEEASFLEPPDGMDVDAI